jgi:heme-degrading monooxygenase HmoA
MSIFSCVTKNKSESNMNSKAIMEVTTFNINSDVEPMTFLKRDAQVEIDFTSKQPGFINRQSGLDDDGNYVVIVYWETITNADSSMGKFMADTSVADYAAIIEATTMKMERYTINNTYNAMGSQFVELMAFDLNPETNIADFDNLNQKVETDFTGKRDGFLQRLTGVNNAGKQVVAVYWASKETSDASFKPFMEAPIAKEFMKEMNQSSILMGRYSLLY